MCEFKGSSRAPGGLNNGVRHSNDVLQAHANVKNKKYKGAYGPSLLLLLLLRCILLLLVDLSYVLWGPSRHLGSLTTANWVSFDFNVAYSSC